MAPITKKKHILQSFNHECNLLSSIPSSISHCAVNLSSNNLSSKSPLSSVSFPVIRSNITSSSSSTLDNFNRNDEYNQSRNHSHTNENSSSSNDDHDKVTHLYYDSDMSDGKGRSDQRMLLSPQYARVNRVILDKNSDEYRKRRERNNIAVKKSRTKSKMKNAETMKKVNELKHENETLRSKVICLATELELLKNVLAAHASTAHGAHLSELDLKLLTTTEALSRASRLETNNTPPPSPPNLPSSWELSKHLSHLRHHQSDYDRMEASAAAASSLMAPSSFCDSLIQESIIHLSQNSSPASSVSSSVSSISPIMSPIMSPSLVAAGYIQRRH